jgi:hypothetical protein
MPAMVLPKGSIVKVATTAAPSTKFALTEHNRSELSVDVERIERSQRMANGRMRKWHIADKRTYNISWELVPHSSTYTLDGFWGGQDMQTFFNNNLGEFYLYVRTPTGTEEQVLVTFNGGLNSSVQKRGASYEMWNVSMVLEEV